MLPNPFIVRMIELLQKVLSRITDDSNMMYTAFDKPGDLRTVLQKHIEFLQNGDTSRIFSLKVEFLPTGSLQEHSLNNGWSDEFLKLANEMDTLCEKIAQQKEKDSRSSGGRDT